MAHIHTAPGQHDFTISAFIMRTDGPEPRVLLHRHRLLGTYLQFGGHIELDETPWDALAHEILEESGYEMPQLRLLQPKQRLRLGSTRIKEHPIPFSFVTHPFGDDGRHFHNDLAYAFVTEEEPRHAPGEGETSSFELLTAAAVRALPEDEIYQEIREAALYALEHLLHEAEEVPDAALH